MTALSETSAPQEGTRFLPDKVTRQLILKRGRSGLLLEDFDEGVLENQRRFGHSSDDFAGIVQAHQNTTSLATVLGVHEEIRKRCTVVVGGKDIEFVEATPRVTNTWVGEYVELYTPNEAAAKPYAGRTALEWATQGGSTPEMVVRANDGYFYPATKNDVVISTPIR